MESVSKWLLTDAEKVEYITALSANLSALRTQAELSQEDLANIVGISRQTYSAIERKRRQMAWSTYLSLVFFFDHNKKTHKMVRILHIFPKSLVARFNDGFDYSSFEISFLLGEQSQDIIEHLDLQAIQSIRSMVMMEYARCTQLPSEAIIKSFGGLNVSQSDILTKDTDAARAIKSIKRKNKKNAE